MHGNSCLDILSATSTRTDQLRGAVHLACMGTRVPSLSWARIGPGRRFFVARCATFRSQSLRGGGAPPQGTAWCAAVGGTGSKTPGEPAQTRTGKPRPLQWSVVPPPDSSKEGRIEFGPVPIPRTQAEGPFLTAAHRSDLKLSPWPRSRPTLTSRRSLPPRQDDSLEGRFPCGEPRCVAGLCKPQSQERLLRLKHRA